METALKIQKDEFGFQYLEELPEGTRFATIDDFHVSGSKKTGMEYYLQSIKPNKYYIKTLTQHTTGAFIQQYIERGQVFIQT